MRYLLAAAAVLCAASGAEAAVSIPVVPVGKWATVTFHGVGQVSSLEIDNPDVSDPVFAGLLGQRVRVSVSFRIFREFEEDIPFIDQDPDGVKITRLDTGRSWGGFGSGEGSLYPEGFWLEDAPSWWGYAAAVNYEFATDSGWFGLRLYEDDPTSESGQSLSEGSGNWTITKVTVSVPEPATWGLLIAGFGLVGAAVRRQRRAGRYPASRACAAPAPGRAPR